MNFMIMLVCVTRHFTSLLKTENGKGQGREDGDVEQGQEAKGRKAEAVAVNRRRREVVEAEAEVLLLEAADVGQREAEAGGRQQTLEREKMYLLWS